MKTLYIIILAVCWALAFPAGADEVIHGEKGNWNARWFGFNTDDPSRLSGASSVVAQAIEMAQSGNESHFYTFWNIDSNSPPAQIRAWYNEWKSCSQRYVYVIGQEAVFGSDAPSSSNQYAAISIAPSQLRRQASGGMMTNMLQLRTQVVFARKVAGVWKLLPDTLDKKIEQALMSRVSILLYQPQDFTANGIAEQQRKFHSDALQMMSKNGVPPEGIVSQRERYQLDELGIKIECWSDWTNYFKAVILDPPVAFEKREVYTYNYRDPVSAFRSYAYATFLGDAKTMLKYADPSGVRFLKSLGVDSSVKAGCYDLTNALTHVVVLLTASTTFEGKEYTLVFWRGQNERDPQHGPVALQKTVFLHQDGEYFMTKDLEDSYFGNILEIAHAAGGMWKHINFEKTLKQSAFPASFYALP